MPHLKQCFPSQLYKTAGIDVKLHTQFCNSENVQEVKVERKGFNFNYSPLATFSLIFKTMAVNSWADIWSSCTDLLADSAYTATNSTEGSNADLFRAPSNSSEKPLVLPRGHNRAPLNQWHAVDDWDKPEGDDSKKKEKKVQPGRWFPSICYHGRAQDAVDSEVNLHNPDDTILRFSFVLVLSQWASSSPSLSQSHTKRRAWKIRLTRKYAQKSSNKNKSNPPIVVKIRYQVTPPGKEQSTFRQLPLVMNIPHHTFQHSD